jgi:hypothetical protein
MVERKKGQGGIMEGQIGSDVWKALLSTFGSSKNVVSCCMRAEKTCEGVEMSVCKKKRNRAALARETCVRRRAAMREPAMPNSNVWSEWNKASHTKRLRNDDQKRVCVIKLGMNLSKMPANEFSALRDSMSLAAGFAVEAMRPLDTVVTMSPTRKGWT